MNIDEQRSGFNDWVKTFCDYEDLSVYELDIMQAAWIASANRQGYKLVPVEPTSKMVEMGFYSSEGIEGEMDRNGYGESIAYSCYKAMIGAAE